MKKCPIPMFFFLVAGIFLLPGIGTCQDMSDSEILQELKAMKARIEVLEKELAERDKAMESLKEDFRKAHIAGRGEEVIPPIKAQAEPEGPRWYDRIEFSGAVEAEFGNRHEESKDNTVGNFPSQKIREHDLSLATVELGVDAQINKYTRGHLLFLYEEDEDGVSLDEGTIFLGGIEETYGLYLLAGKYYPHFGELNSFLVSDPLTQEIFEIQESAAQASGGSTRTEP